MRARARWLLAGTAIGLACVAAEARAADTRLWVDDDTGHVAQVDLATGAVVPGSVVTVSSPGFDLSKGLSDIAFTSSGTLYGSTFTNLFSIDPRTGAATNLGVFGGVLTMNALVGDGIRLLGASSTVKEVFGISPKFPGLLAVYAPTPAVSAGDLAFAGPVLYESAFHQSAVNGEFSDELVNVSTGAEVGDFQVGGLGGATLLDVFGLADDGPDMYAFAGTEVYRVNLADAVLTPLFDYAGEGLTSARGAAFLGEASHASPVPEPGTLGLLGAGFAGAAWAARRRSSRLPLKAGLLRAAGVTAASASSVERAAPSESENTVYGTITLRPPSAAPTGYGRYRAAPT